MEEKLHVLRHRRCPVTGFHILSACTSIISSKPLTPCIPRYSVCAAHPADATKSPDISTCLLKCFVRVSSSRCKVYSPTNDSEIQPSLRTDVPVHDFRLRERRFRTGLEISWSYGLRMLHRQKLGRLSASTRVRLVERKYRQQAVAHELENLSAVLFLSDRPQDQSSRSGCL